MMRHRDAGAVERRAPTRGEAQAAEDASSAEEGPAEGRRRVVAPEPAPQGGGEEPALEDDDLPRDVLVVVSKLKKYIRARSGMNTSDGVTDILSEHVRRLCDEAIRNAGRDGRRTVMDRDFPDPDAP